ncbi:hypothetical protein SADUNF_Sadunf04G0086000 [Salix dunnii]|uniref:DUF8040 domain-containing protein n=1 Tax=Salix dunnii TaxID=1413687 RepID=A0A835KB61_9ROSI|nr:hypothetical protein SADUNF_Sadunf04G0086000 [Salix dunnii]
MIESTVTFHCLVNLATSPLERNRVIQERFQHSGESISQHFTNVLKGNQVTSTRIHTTTTYGHPPRNSIEKISELQLVNLEIAGANIDFIRGVEFCAPKLASFIYKLG